ncbi:hypothetical protein EWM64_g8050 [Hericium alpestre]|uniref:Uncharacterized protein n=1 Tax=Hericium alpestre TaxID=135208 RepID=A0A4Y9ZQ59_9AGAM|nr:hypothetical protein EWM64_g8050 [Hericium alpestre]
MPIIDVNEYSPAMSSTGQGEGSLASTYDPNIIQPARQKIDDEGAARQNMLPPISNLPFEILGRIFRFHAAGEPPGDADTLGWIRATHVCRFWRDTALQYAGLWTDVTDRLGQEWAKEMLVRAKSVPISYSQRSESSTAGDPSNKAMAGPAIAEELFRIRHLSIDEPTRAMNTILKSMMASPAPILESLCLEDTNEGSDVACIFLSDIFNAHFPMLRRLELHGILILWSAPILRGLTHLYIVNTRYTAHHRFGEISDSNVTAQFFCALREMTALETVHLSFCLPEEPQDTQNIQTVMLPRVEKLTLCSPLMDECSGVLRHLEVLPSCDVTVECGQILPEPLEEIFLFVKTRAFSVAHQPPFLTMYLSTALENGSDYPDPGLQLRFWTASNIPDLAGLRRNWEDVPSTSILVERCPEGELPLELIADVSILCKSSPWDIIRNLVIGSDGKPDWTLTPEDWIYIFDRYTEVENLSVMGKVAQSLCAALGISMPLLQLREPAEGEDGRQLSEEELFLGKLRRIGFEEVDFRGDYDRGESEGEEEDHAVSTNAYSLLKTSLSRRRSASAAPLMLVITRCSIEPDQIRGLQEVAEIYWDLVEDLFSEDKSDASESDEDNSDED